jgi:peptide/nickel transport system permease protein
MPLPPCTASVSTTVSAPAEPIRNETAWQSLSEANSDDAAGIPARWMEGDKMYIWLSKRLLQAVLVMLAMTVIVFIGVNVIGNPVDILISPDADQAERLRIIQQLGLDQPLWMQYLQFLKGAVQGNLGDSYVYNQPALQVILQRLPATLELAISAMVISIIVGIPLGLYAGLRSDGWLAKALMAGSILGFSLPTFWIGLMFIMVFAVQLGWLPSSGRGTTVNVLGVDWSFFTLDGLRHLLLPALNLSLFKTALVMRLTRAGVHEVMPQDYVRYARARGLTERRVISVHVLKNIMIPVVTVIGLEFGSVIAFSVVTESIFAWPGMGKLIIDSINVLDRPIMVAYLMMIVLVFVCINLIVDLIYTLLDPRVRLSSKGSA